MKIKTFPLSITQVLVASFCLFAMQSFANEQPTGAKAPNASDPSNTSHRKLIESLHTRLQILESEQASKTSSQPWSDKLGFAGAIEVEATSFNDYQGVASSDITLATAELGLVANINNNVAAGITLLYEERDTPLDIDVAVMRYTKQGFSLLAGKTYVPFGAFETHLVNDTLVLELAETNETAIVAGYDAGLLSARLYFFNGDVDSSHDTVNDVGARITFSDERWAVGVDYLSNVLDSDGFSSAIDDAGLINNMSQDLPAVIINATYGFDVIDVIVEVFQSGTLKARDAGGLITDDAEFKAYQAELAADLSLWTLALSYQKTEKAQIFGLPERRLALGAGSEIMPSTRLGLEIWADKDYATNNGGTGEDSLGLVIQLAVAF